MKSEGGSPSLTAALFRILARRGRRRASAMKFTKMHGLGNDYVYVDCIHQSVDDLPGLARRRV